MVTSMLELAALVSRVYDYILVSIPARASPPKRLRPIASCISRKLLGMQNGARAIHHALLRN